MSLTFVINVFDFDVSAVFVTDVIANIIFDIEVTVIITFAIVDFTAIIIDIHLLAVLDVVNVIFVFVAIASFVINDTIVGTDIDISICSTTFFLFGRCQRIFAVSFLG